ncbi:class II fructose-bisphosphate aldolase [Eubacteriaceae bacterium ES3]|nr:class II fructose-bisphosphate aldolase [Eubacteriaceae bacterium ES3]
MLVNLKEILEKAVKGNYAIGAFNTPNLETIQAVITAAEITGIPVILNHAQIHDKIAPLDLIGPLMVKLAQKSSAEICVHLDHGEDEEYIRRAIEMGFTSAMFDGSKLSYQENLNKTKAIVKIAHAKNVSVEAELGRVLRPEGGGVDPAEEDLNPENYYTDPQKAKDFSDETGIDALAISFGTAHGLYDIAPMLDFNRIQMIRKKTDIPLVMHGGSGLSQQDFLKAIDAGINKVNYFTYLSLAGGEAVAELYQQKKFLRFDEISECGRLVMQKHTESKLKLFKNNKD